MGRKGNQKFVVYKHTSPPGKIYIGITSQYKAEYRWGYNGDGYKDNKYFYRAIKKYGWDNFKHEILFKNLSKDEAIQKEIELISLYNSKDSKIGYNQTGGGDGLYTPSDEIRTKLGSGNRGKHLSEQTKLKMSLSNKNKIHGKWYNNGEREILLKDCTDVPHGFIPGKLPMKEETKIKLSLIHSGVPSKLKGRKTRPLSDKIKHKISEAKLGKLKTEETKLKMKLAQNRRTPEWNKKISDSKLGHLVSNDVRNKISKSKSGIVSDKLGKRYYNNGTINKLFSNSDEIPKEFIIGKLKRKGN